MSETRPLENILLNRLDSMYWEAYYVREESAKSWESNFSFYLGKQWATQRPRYKSDFVLNMAMPLIERMAGLLTDSKPSGDVSTKRKDLEGVAQMLTKVIYGIWTERNIDQSLVSAITYGTIFGSMILKVVWDPTLDNGSGDIDVIPVDPRSMLIDPAVVRGKDLQKAEYVIHEEVRSIDEIKEMFPERGHLIKADPKFSMYEEKSSGSLFGKISGQIRSIFIPNRERLRDSAVQRSLLQEFWIKDRSKDENGNYLFPGGRLITRVGNVILQDISNPYWDGLFPFEMSDWKINLNSVWGVSEIEGIKSPQATFNRVMGHIIDNATFMNNIVFIGDEDALAPDQWDEITNGPGIFIKKRVGRELRREAPPSLPPYIFSTLSVLSQGIESITGMHEASQGRRPGEVRSGIGIEALQTAAQTLIRLRARKLESMFGSLGHKIISRIFQFYTKDRMFHIIGDSGEMTDFLFERSKILSEDVETDPLTGSIIVKPQSQNIKEAFKDFKFFVVPGSSLSITKMQKVMLAVSFFNLGVIDDEALLEAAEYPNREKILRRVIAKRKEMATQAQTLPVGKVKGGTKSLSGVPKPLRQRIGVIGKSGIGFD